MFWNYILLSKFLKISAPFKISFYLFIHIMHLNPIHFHIPSCHSLPYHAAAWVDEKSSFNRHNTQKSGQHNKADTIDYGACCQPAPIMWGWEIWTHPSSTILSEPTIQLTTISKLQSQRIWHPLLVSTETRHADDEQTYLQAKHAYALDKNK